MTGTRAARLTRPAIFSAAAALVSVFAGAGFALAAGDAGHASEHHLSSGDWFNFGASVFNFCLFVFLFHRFTSAPLRDFLASRRKELVEAMSAAARAKEEAERVQAEYQEKLAGLDQAREELTVELRAMAEADGKRLLVAAREAAERMLTEAGRTARSDYETARVELRAEAARLAAELASTTLASKLGDADRNRLIEEFLKEVSAAEKTTGENSVQ
ncbi:MAG: hypothetical protein HRT46_00505 [Deltaproteobacteria bacterium]|nr:hypothetical protein [Deltaproteobacteria bacterium]